MTERQTGENTQRMGTGMKRRRLLAGAAAVVAGFAAKQASQPVGAAATPLTYPAANGDPATTAFAFNTVILKAGAPLFGLLLNVDASTATSAFATAIQATGHGALGSGVSATGGDGTGSSKGGIGVLRGGGFALGTGPGGVGLVARVGPSASGQGGYGVQGEAGGGTATAGVIGLNAHPAPGGMGVQGIYQSTGTGGIGVLGQSDTTAGIGVQGQSTKGVGVLGISNAPGNVGAGGIANVAGTAAFAGTSTNPNAFAGFFTGDVFVNGNFTVNDPTRKHGAIAHPDGSYRILYSMESPESWLEDFGVGQLVGGKADVRLDADFAAVVQTGEYHVFLTPYDGVGALRAARRTAAGFAVEEIGGASSGGFSYRVVARPKTTNKAVRLAKFVIADIKVPKPPPMSAAPPQPMPLPRATGPAGASPTGAPVAAPQGSGTTTATGTAVPTVQAAPPPRP